MKFHRISWPLLSLGGLLFLTPLFGDSIDVVQGEGLEIQTTPSVADVYLNGIKRGTTPLTLTGLPATVYDLVLSKEGYQEERLTVTISGGNKIMVTKTLTPLRGTVAISIRRGPGGGTEGPSFPSAEILVDDLPVKGPQLSLSVGLHTLRVRAFGYEDEKRSVYVSPASVTAEEFVLRPAAFRVDTFSVDRSRFNPQNPGLLGTVEFSFFVSAPGWARLKVVDSSGTVVFSKNFNDFTSWLQHYRWDGRDPQGLPVADGTYSVVLSAGPPSEQGTETYRLRLPLRVDSSMVVRPGAAFSGLPGLLFAPDPDLSSAPSFQFDTALLFGLPYQSAGLFQSLPFAAALSVVPLDRWNITASASVTPQPGSKGDTALGASVTHAFKVPPGTLLPKTGVSVAYLWSSTDGATPFNGRPGFLLGLPLAWEISNPSAQGAPPLRPSVVFSPALTWTSGASMPRLVGSGALAVRGNTFTGGISAQSDFCLDGASFWDGAPVLWALEFHFFPAPSLFVLSGYTGGWIDPSSAGMFVGFGAGILR